MERRFFLAFVLTSLFGVLHASTLHAQIMAWGEYGVDTIKLNLARTEGLMAGEQTVQDSGKPSYTTIDRFYKRGDSVWEYSQFREYRDTGNRKMLFDSSNRLLFESDYHNNGYSQGRESYYYFYDTMGRVIKKTYLWNGGNQLTIGRFAYNSRGDSVVVKDFDEKGKLRETELHLYDKYGNELFWNSKYVALPDSLGFESAHNVYDSRGCLIERGSPPAIKSSRIARSLMEKIVYVDSLGVENGWDYRWADTSWSKFPTEHWRMDSVNLRRVSEDFDTTGAVISTEAIDFISLRHPSHSRYEKPKENYIEEVAYTYDSHGQLTSEKLFDNNHFVRTRTYTYTYSK